MENSNRLSSFPKATKVKNYNNPPTEQKKPVEIKLDVKKISKPIFEAPKESDLSVSQERLQEAIIWSEILGKPVSKRGKRRM